MRLTSACALWLVTAGCGNPAAPSTELRGRWDFNYSARGQDSCPADPQLVPGCAGSGRLVIDRTSPQVEATHSYRASCQSCRSAFDYGVTEQPLRTASVSGRTFEFALAGCRFTAEAPELAQTVAGTVVCTVDEAAGVNVRGSWTMSRDAP